MKVYKNFLEKKLLKKIQDRVFSQDFPWYWRNNMVYNKKDHYWFNHAFFNNKQILSPHYEEWIIPIIKKLKFKELIEARCNMMTKENFSYTSDLHIDYDIKNGKTAILYLNTCNGGTYIKEKMINSEENKMVIFPCKTLHRGVSQTDVDRRAVININYI